MSSKIEEGFQKFLDDFEKMMNGNLRSVRELLIDRMGKEAGEKYFKEHFPKPNDEK